MAARWTEEELSVLRARAASGATGKAIARELGRPHNGVIGKARSLGLRLQKREDFPPSAVRVLEALKVGPRTPRELCVELRMSDNTLGFAVRRLREKKAIHILRYQRVRVGRPTQVLAAGWGKEPPYPGPLTNAQVVAAYARRKVAEDPEYYARQYARRRPPRPDPAAAWLFKRKPHDETGESDER